MRKELKITLVKSKIGVNKKHKLILKSLGLNKIDQTKILPDTPSLRGVVKKLDYLLKVEER
jgi:large subunit ribosomal protein L30